MKIRDRIFLFTALAKLRWGGAKMAVLDTIICCRHRKRQHEINYRIDDFLKMDDQVKAYYALCDAIRKENHIFSPAELRILSLPDFLGLCCANGFGDLYWQARWAAIPSAELMEAIGEPVFAEMLRRCIAIAREYGQKIGRDPFDPNSEYVKLDEETEHKFDASELDFCKQDFDWDLLCCKAMEYVRKNRVLFTKPNQP
jgi:hypothetical protein